MKWTVRENGNNVCPGLRLEDLPNKIPANMHILHNNGMLSIASENIAGVLPCKNGHEIVIEPKYSKIKPVDLMLYIGNISGIVVNRERISSGKSEIGIQTIADAFVEQLNIIQSHTKKFKRAPQKVITTAVAGKVDWIKTYKAQLQGNLAPVHATVMTPTHNIPENVLIGAAAKKIVTLYPTGSKEFDILFPWVKLSNEYKYSYNELFTLHQRLNEKTLSGAHAFYYAPVMLAKIILGFNGAEQQTEDIDTILFNMPGLYEDFIRTGFQRMSSKYGYSVQKGFIPRSFLFCNGDCELIPDITVYEGSTIRTLMDVKYKTPDSKDHYQLFTYMKYAQTDVAYIISPEVEHGQTITAFDGSKIVYIQIDTSDFDELERIAEQTIRDLI